MTSKRTPPHKQLPRIRLLIFSYCSLEMTRRSEPAVAFTEALRRSRLYFQCFGLAIPRRRIGDQRFEQMVRGMGDFVDRVIKGGFVRLRWFSETA